MSKHKTNRELQDNLGKKWTAKLLRRKAATIVEKNLENNPSGYMPVADRIVVNFLRGAARQLEHGGNL